MPNGGPNRQIYDSVFCNLFQDPKYQLEAYKAIHPEDESVTVEDIKDVTLEAVIATLNECKEKSILKDYIIEHEAEVIDIMMALYDKDSYMKLHDLQKKKEGGLEMLASLVKKGRLTVEEAANESNMTVADFKEEAGLVAAQ